MYYPAKVTIYNNIKFIILGGADLCTDTYRFIIDVR